MYAVILIYPWEKCYETTDELHEKKLKGKKTTIGMNHMKNTFFIYEPEYVFLSLLLLCRSKRMRTIDAPAFWISANYNGLFRDRCKKLVSLPLVNESFIYWI